MTVAATLLAFAELSLPEAAARGISQSLKPIDEAADIATTINGEAIDLSDVNFRKYQSTISCTDMRTMTRAGLWPGMILTVDCICELYYATAGGSPDRTVVSGSTRVEGDRTYFRPRLTMMLVEISGADDEFAADTAWEMHLIEVAAP
jgi:hypothetical protein